MRGKLALCAIAAVVLALVYAGSALAWTKITVTPKNPHVDDDVTLSFSAPYALRKGWTWSAILTGPFGNTCASIEDANSRTPTKKGKTVRLRFSPGRSTSAPGASEWCQGKVLVSVFTAKGNKVGHGAGSVAFRFIAQP